MALVELAYYKIKKINMMNNIEDFALIAVANRDHFSVTYDEDSDMAIATLTEYVEVEKNPSQFLIELTLEAVFAVNDDVSTEAQKETAHRECYDKLFPVARKIIKYLTVNSGMSEGLTIPKQPLKKVNFGAELEPQDDKIVNFPLV